MIKSIQLLRAIAALSVVFYHCHFHHIETGMFGVDIFFIISGFIIAYMVNQTTNLFIIKRIIRVCPLYYMATLLTIGIALVKPQWFNHVIINTETLVKSFFYIPYDIRDSGPILASGWTLNNEMFFYGVMFLCILIFRKKEYLVPACAGILITLVIVLNSFNKDTISAYSYILRFYRNGLLPEFIYGLGLYHFWIYYGERKTKAINMLMLLTGLAAFVVMLYIDLSKSAMLNLPRNVHYGIPALLFANAFLVLEHRFNAENIIVKTGLKLGDASYAMYLFHPFVVYFLVRIVYPKIPGSSSVIQLAELLFSLVLVAIASVLIYDYIDKPLTELFKKRIKKYNETRAAKLTTRRAEIPVYGNVNNNQ